MPLHEWTEETESEKNVITWLFEQDTFVPATKLVTNGGCFSITSGYFATPLQAYDKQGNKVWEQELDIYGRKGNAPPRSFRLSTKGSTRMQRQDSITIGSGITTRMREVISAKTR